MTADLLVVAALFAFFALAVAFVRACERIIGPDLEAAMPATDQTARERDDPDRRVA